MRLLPGCPRDVTTDPRPRPPACSLISGLLPARVRESRSRLIGGSFAAVARTRAGARGACSYCEVELNLKPVFAFLSRAFCEPMPPDKIQALNPSSPPDIIQGPVSQETVANGTLGWLGAGPSAVERQLTTNLLYDKVGLPAWA